MSLFNTQKLLEKAYILAKNQFSNKIFTFNNLWSLIWKNTSELKKEEVKEWIGNFYLELLQDYRFINCGINSWRLREYITFEEIKKIKNTMFNLPAEELLEDDALELIKQESTKEITNKEDPLELSEEDYTIYDTDETTPI